MRHLAVVSTVLISLAAGCAADYEEAFDTSEGRLAATCEPLGAMVSDVVFTSEQATAVIDLVESATEDELRVIPYIGRLTAQRIIAARPFRAQENPLAALDEIPYVGVKALNTLKDGAFDTWCKLDDGRQSCCVEVACEAGTVLDGASVDHATAIELLDWANRATLPELEAVCAVDPTLAKALVDARPPRSVENVFAVPQMGAAPLKQILGMDTVGCESQGSVADEWCGLPQASCFCAE